MKSQIRAALYASLAGITLSSASILVTAPAQAVEFRITKLVSDTGDAIHKDDTDLINPWGLASSPTSPFWVANNGTGVSTIYDSNGVKQPLMVTVNPSGAAPTGLVFNGGGGSTFQVSEGSKSGSALFVFSGEEGTISGWSPSVATNHTVVAVPSHGAIYKGLAIGATGASEFLYATDFHNNAIEQYDSGFNLVRSFTDPGVQKGYAPFGARVLNGHLFVTYALQDDDREDDVAGAGHGYVDEFDLDGNLVRQIATLGGPIDSPWGLDIAPASFGQFAGDLLVGNFGDGTIGAFNLTTGMFDGWLRGTDGNPIVLGDLWALINGNGGRGGDPNRVYFTAGVADEAHGLLGSLTPAPEPASWAMMISGFLLTGATMRAASARRRLSVAR